MAKAPRQSDRLAPAVKSAMPREFKSLGWSEYRKPSEYIWHLQTELLRFGFDIYDKGLVPLHSKPIQEIVAWHNEFPNGAYADLHNWRSYNLEEMKKRDQIARGRGAGVKPRIDVVPELTTKRNLSVKWYPTGYLEAVPDWDNRGGGFTTNAIRGLLFKEPPDFTYFTKESYEWGARPANELLFLRGIGGLYIDDSPFDSAPYKLTSLEEIIVCTARSIFNQVVSTLR